MPPILVLSIHGDPYCQTAKGVLATLVIRTLSRVTNDHSYILNPTGTERPLRRDGGSPASLGQSMHEAGTGPLDERALLPDADGDMRKHRHHLLGKTWNVETAGDSGVALAAILRRRPDLLIMNAAMPGIDARLVHVIPDDPGLRELPVIVLCAGAAQRPDGLETGPDDYLEKPSSARELTAYVRADRKPAKVRRQRMAALDENERRYRAVIVAERSLAEDRRPGNELWRSRQKEAFRAAMDGASLAMLGILTRTAIEQAADDRRSAFYIADDSGSLRHGVGMPESCARTVDGIGITPESNCGLAVITGKPVIVRDFCDEPRWPSLLPIAEEYDYRGVRSFPVETVSGKIIGTFRNPGGMQQ